jgi:hypothetical protein
MIIHLKSEETEAQSSYILYEQSHGQMDSK